MQRNLRFHPTDRDFNPSASRILTGYRPRQTTEQVALLCLRTPTGDSPGANHPDPILDLCPDRSLASVVAQNNVPPPADHFTRIPAPPPIQASRSATKP
ncbi:MAG: hypothetical protein AAF998_15635 [Bacteroidota bacterium]